MIGIARGLRRPSRAVFGVALFATPLLSQTTPAQQAWNPQAILRTETFVRPPAAVEKIILAPRTDITFTAPSPDRKWFLRTTGVDRGDIDEYGKPHLYLGGIQVDTKANRNRSLTTSTHDGLRLMDPRTLATRTIETPKGASISSQNWSPTGTQVAYIANFDDASHLFVADVATGKSVQLTKMPLLATLVTEVAWTADGKNIVLVLVPEVRGPAPTHGKNGVEDGPKVRLTESRALPQPIHASLLEDPHDKAILKYYSTGQLAIVDVKTKAVKKIGSPAMIRSVDAAPDGQYFRVTMMTEPFSYLVPASNFGSTQELWDANGKLVATLAKTPLREGDQSADDAPAFGRGGPQQTASDTGKRNIQWNPVGAGLVYLQSVFAAGGVGATTPAGGRAGRGGAPGAGRGGQPARPRPTSVRYMKWLPPYAPGDTTMLYEGTAALTAVAFSADAKTMFVSDSGVFAVRVADPSRKFALGRGITLGGGGGGRGGGFGGGAPDTTGGGPLTMKRGINGQPVVVLGTDNKSVVVAGARMPGANWVTQAPRPWVDRLDIETATRTRVFESPADAYEEFVAALDDDYSQYLYTRESPTVIADVYLRDAKTGASTQITHNTDVAPEVTGAQHKRFQVTRQRDGIKFWVDVTMPRDWKAGTRLPGIIWFYPREYTSQANYDQSRLTTNINKFPDVPSLRPASTTRLWVTQGYAVIEPDFPIIGDSGKMNDNYTRDIKENLDAVLDAAVDAGLVDRDKMGVGGHSYGAFSTVNALTLTPYFKAGIAGDGMYNRSLTPFGFQSERRNFFQAQATYLDMSPFYRADRISAPLLMYHSSEDQNQGTAPISSTRMFLALQGLGKPAALYMYPYEDHSVATYASDLDLWARWFAWFDVYVKNPKVDQKPTP